MVGNVFCCLEKGRGLGSSGEHSGEHSGVGGVPGTANFGPTLAPSLLNGKEKGRRGIWKMEEKKALKNITKGSGVRDYSRPKISKFKK